jgi:ADP-heptose:LPS heptosyltransferase
LRDRLVRALFRPPRAVARPVRRILVIRPDQVGDLLFATPALARLREAFPAAHITGLIGPWGRGTVWERLPELTEVRTCPFPGIVARPARPWDPYVTLRTVAAALRPQAFDLALVLRFDYWWGALLAEQAAIPHRWGYGLPVMRPYLTMAEPYWPGRHEGEQNLALVEAVIAAAADGTLPVLHGELGPAEPEPVDRERGIPPLYFPLRDEERAWADAQRASGPMGQPAIAIHPGSNATIKLWTPEGWAAVTRWLLERDFAVVFTGTKGEHALIETIRSRLTTGQQAAVPNLAGQTSLGQLAALFATLPLVLGVDNGPLHLATAVGTPTVRLYGPSDETLWGPWGPAPLHRVVRAPGTVPTGDLQPGRTGLAGGPEMLAITPEQVIAAMEDALGVDEG